MKKLQIICIVLILGTFSTFFFIGALITPPEAVLKTERRTVAPFPPLALLQKFSNLQKFFSEFDYYIADRLLLKEAIFKTASNFYTENFYSYGKYQNIKGLDGWFFLGNNTNNIIDKHVSPLPLDLLKTEKMLSRLSTLKAASEKMGSRFFVLVGSDKTGIYYEYLPKHFQCQAHSRYADKLIQAIEARNIPIFDTFKTLKENKDQGLLYYTTDSHWNMLGAHFAFSAMYSWMQNNITSKPLAGLEPYSLEAAPGQPGDVASSSFNMRPDGKEIKDNFTLNLKRDYLVSWEDGIESTILRPLSRPSPGPGYLLMRSDKATNSMRILLIHDSFAIALAPYFNMAFSEVMYVPRRGSTARLVRLIEEFQADIVIYETVERSL